MRCNGSGVRDKLAAVFLLVGLVVGGSGCGGGEPQSADRLEPSTGSSADDSAHESTDELPNEASSGNPQPQGLHGIVVCNHQGNQPVISILDSDTGEPLWSAEITVGDRGCAGFNSDNFSADYRYMGATLNGRAAVLDLVTSQLTVVSSAAESDEDAFVQSDLEDAAPVFARGSDRIYWARADPSDVPPVEERYVYSSRYDGSDLRSEDLSQWFYFPPLRAVGPFITPNQAGPGLEGSNRILNGNSFCDMPNEGLVPEQAFDECLLFANALQSDDGVAIGMVDETAVLTDRARVVRFEPGSGPYGDAFVRVVGWEVVPETDRQVSAIMLSDDRKTVLLQVDDELWTAPVDGGDPTRLPVPEGLVPMEWI